MAFILALESATKCCSVSLFKDGELLASKEEKGEYSHAENLAVFVDSLLKETKIKAKDLSAVAVSKGPGSYTGLRIGTSLAKGLCYSLNIPLIAISTLKSIAWGVSNHLGKNDNYFICPLIDARRMEAYTTVYTPELEELQTVSAKILETNTFIDYLNKRKVYFAGDGAHKYEGILHHQNANFFHEDYISSLNMGELAMLKFQEKDFENLAYYEPYYHKEFVAVKGKKLI